MTTFNDDFNAIIDKCKSISAKFKSLSRRQQMAVGYLYAKNDTKKETVVRALDFAGYNGTLEYTRFVSKPTVQATLIDLGLRLEIPREQLSDKQLMFVDAYMSTFNAKLAALEAGYSSESDGLRLLNTPSIRLEIQDRQEELKTSSQISAARILFEYARIGFADIGNYVDIDNGIITLKPLDEVDTTVVSEISNGKYGPTIKLHNKLKALDALAKYLGLFKERIEVTGKDGEKLSFESSNDRLADILEKMATATKGELTHDSKSGG